MDKKDLIVQLAKKTGSTQSSAKKFLEAFTDLIADNLTVDNKIRIVGFGTFEVRARSERKGINPATFYISYRSLFVIFCSYIIGHRFFGTV